MAKIRTRTIKWNASKATDVAGYKFYWNLPGMPVDYATNFVDVGNKTEIKVPDEVTGLPADYEGDLVVGVSAYDTTGNESDIAKATFPLDFAAPDAPTGLIII